MKVVSLQSIQSDCGLNLVFEVHKAEEILAAILGGLGDQPRTQKARKRTEDMAHFALCRIGWHALLANRRCKGNWSPPGLCGKALVVSYVFDRRLGLGELA